MNILFNGKEHKEFFCAALQKCSRLDVYHMALLYCLGIGRDTREHAEDIYDFKEDRIRTEALHQEWITSGSVKIICLAFNLYCSCAPSIYDYEDNPEGQLQEYARYTVDELFCSDNARYFWQAIQLRYPEYC